MIDAAGNIGLGRYLASRLLPLSIGIGLLLSVVSPVIYWIFEHHSVEHQATLFAEDLAGDFRRLAQENPALWRYQTYKFISMAEGFRSTLDVMGFEVLDERSEEITGHDYRKGGVRHNGKLGFWEEFNFTRAFAPIMFNDRRVGTVEITVSDARILRTTAFLLFCSVIVGTSLAILVYQFPVRVVRRLEGEIHDLINNLNHAKVESERLHAEAAESEQRFRELVQGLDAIVWEADAATWNYFFVSQQAEQILGYPVARWQEDPAFWMKHIHPDDCNRVVDCYEIAILEGSGFQLEYRVLAADGRQVWLRDMVRVVEGAGEGGKMLRGVMVDITSFKEAEAALAEKSQELIRSNAELEQFAYVASHDLQEPLRMVASYVQLLSRRYKGKLDANADEFIAFAVDGATRMQRLINDLLMYSRVGTKGKELVPTDSAEVLRNALANLQVAIEEAGAQVTCGELPMVMADAGQFTQLFQNLVGNALKFRGDRLPEVRVAAEQIGAMWRFVVRDNGIGIDPEFHERIFMIFQRLHSRSEYPGTGIGLAVCRKIVERHGGDIWLESEPGQGTTFYFTIAGIEGA